MSPEQIRLECLRLAAERVGPAAKLEDLFSEAKRLQNYVEGFEFAGTVRGEEVWGKRI
jgi:hypothetical protein